MMRHEVGAALLWNVSLMRFRLRRFDCGLLLLLLALDDSVSAAGAWAEASR